MNQEMPAPPETASVQTEELLLGGRRRYTRSEVAELAGVSPERLRDRWRALGFATVDDDKKLFTDADVAAAALSERLFASGVIDPDMEVSVSRALGHHLSRLAEWQAGVMRDWLREQRGVSAPEDTITLVSTVLPVLEHLQNYVWRRHLVAATGRLLPQADEEIVASQQVVGFTDMVGYTRLTRSVDEDTLRTVLEKFESVAGDVIAEHRGRVVKMIGDEVLFVADDPVDAVEIALTLNELADADEDVPELRTGLAYGRTVNRLGDVYGTVVNIAARLTSTARPGTILLDEGLADQIGENPAYELRSVRPAAVRGYSKLRRYVVRRAQ